MKNFFKNCIFFLFILIVLFIPENTYASQNTIPEGYIGIYTVEDLYAVRNNLSGKYILMNDIDLCETKPGGLLDSGTGWTPIAGEEGLAFSGTFDGNGHKIANLCINALSDGSTTYFGLFGYVTGCICNLGLENVQIAIEDGYCRYEVDAYVGAIAGCLTGENAKIEQCYVSGEISYTSRYCTFELDMGGIVGDALRGAVVDNCYSLANVTSADEYAGGICGQKWGASVTYVYAVGKTNDHDQLVGKCWYGGFSGFYLKQNGGTDECGVPLTETQMQNQSYWTDFDFDNTWFIDPCSAYPYPQLKKCPQDPLVSLEIVTLPTKLEYYSSEKLDLSGATVRLIYSSGIDITIPINKNIVSYEWKEGNVDVLVSWVGLTKSFPVIVKNGVFTVYFDENGGLAPDEICKEVELGKKYGALPKAEREKYNFVGWYTKKKGGNLVDKNTVVSLLSDQVLYAHWKKVTVDQVDGVSVSAGKAKLAVRYKKSENVSGYEIQYGTSKTMKGAKTTVSQKLAVSISKLKSATTYYVRVRAFVNDSAGERVYGKWSEIKNVKVK